MVRVDQNLPDKTQEVLDDVFDEGRGVRKRGEQSIKGIGDVSRKAKVKDVAKTTAVQDVAKKDAGKKLEPKAKPRITEFDNVEDWIMSMILVSLLHANPEMSPEEARKEGKLLARKLSMPRTESLWRRQIVRINRSGIRAEASKIRREMYKLI